MYISGVRSGEMLFAGRLLNLPLHLFLSISLFLFRVDRKVESGFSDTCAQPTALLM